MTVEQGQSATVQQHTNDEGNSMSGNSSQVTWGYLKFVTRNKRMKKGLEKAKTMALECKVSRLFETWGQTKPTGKKESSPQGNGIKAGRKNHVIV